MSFEKNGINSVFPIKIPCNLLLGRFFLTVFISLLLLQSIYHVTICKGGLLWKLEHFI